MAWKKVRKCSINFNGLDDTQ